MRCCLPLARARACARAWVQEVSSNHELVDLQVPGHGLAIRLRGDVLGVHAPGAYVKFHLQHVELPW